MKNTPIWVVIILGLVGVAAIGYQWWKNERLGEKVLLPPAVETPTAPPALAEPAIRHPIEQAQSGEPNAGKSSEPPTPLPLLSESDAPMRESLAGLLDGKQLAQFFYLDRIIPRIVATLDNLTRDEAALGLLPVKPAGGPLLVTGSEDSLTISAENYQRYAPYARMAEAVDAKKLVARYVYFYPLFQRSYQELGYPKGYFNDRLVEVIDHLLATPDVAGPVKLVRPRIVYKFADPKLEALSAGQKTMIRMGGDNAAKVKAKLKEIRRELTGRTTKP